jgi:hypothetical protein
MARPAVRPDRLRFRASCVEKHRRPKKAFPAWYYRVAAIEPTQGRDIDPEDFDEDLSELEESRGVGRGMGRRGVVGRTR